MNKLLMLMCLLSMSYMQAAMYKTRERAQDYLFEYAASFNYYHGYATYKQPSAYSIEFLTEIVDCSHFFTGISEPDMTVEEKMVEECALQQCKKALAAQANINEQDDNGNTCLLVSAAKFWIPVVKLLLEQGANITLKNNNGFSFEHYLEEPSLNDTGDTTSKKITYKILWNLVIAKKLQKSSR